jgi:phage anti-repressor protein
MDGYSKCVEIISAFDFGFFTKVVKNPKSALTVIDHVLSFNTDKEIDLNEKNAK